MSAPTGPMIDLDHVQQAVDVVEQAQAQLRQVAAQVAASAASGQAAIQAPAGQVTATAYDELGGGGRVLAEELERLRCDLTALVGVATQGSDDALQAAQAGGTSAGAFVPGRV